MKKAKILSLAFAFSLLIACLAVPVSAASSIYVQSDTTVPFTRMQGETYQVKFTVHGTHSDPKIAAGDGNVLQTLNVVKTKDSSGNDVYYFKVKAVGVPGTSSAIYTTLPGQSAVRHFVITVSKSLTAQEIANNLKEDGLPIGNLIVYTAETDDNQLLGRPNQYISRVRFADNTVDQSDSDDPVGGSIETFNNVSDLEVRKEYCEAISKSIPMFAQYYYVNGNYLLRIDNAVTPENAKKYEEAFAKIQ